MTKLQVELMNFLTLNLSKPLRDKILSSEAKEIVKAVELFIVANEFKRTEKQEDPPHHNFMKEIEKI